MNNKPSAFRAYRPNRFLRVTVFAFFSLAATGCFNLLEKKPDAPAQTAKFGSLTIGEKPAASERKLQVADIESALITVSGFGMGDISAETPIVNGRVSGVTINDIPMGKNRVVTVYARSSVSGTLSNMDGVVMRSITDINAGENSASITWASTPLGSVFNELLRVHKVDVSAIPDADRDFLSTFVVEAQDGAHPLLVDCANIAADYTTGGTAALTTAGALAYQIAPASVSFTVSGAAVPLAARVSDPASDIKPEVADGLHTIAGIAPGSWDVAIVSGDAVLYRATKTFAAGESVSLGTVALTVPAPELTPARTGFTDSVSVEMSCALSGSSIYYTLDGTVPTIDSTPYTGAFTVSETTTVKAIAVNTASGCAPSPVAEKTWIKYTTGTIGFSHPASGSYSPVDLNGATDGFGWDAAVWKPGTHRDGAGITFALYSKNATKVLLELYETKNGNPAVCDYWMEKGADNVWRAKVELAGDSVLYAFRLWGPNWPWDASWTRGGSAAGFVSDVDASGNRFNPNKAVFDPYARELSHDKSNPAVLGVLDAGMFGSGATDYQGAPRRNFDTGPYVPKSVFVSDSTSYGTKPAIPRDDAIIYEAHPRGLTQHSSSASLASILNGIEGFESVPSIPDSYRGTYRGAAMMAPYLKALGVTTIELLPVHETDNDANPDDGPGGNFWGYMTFGYFAPDRRYSSDKTFGGPTREFKEMVKAFHDEGLEVYLDVVYNHSGEGGTWFGSTDGYAAADMLFLRGIDNSEYYSLVSGTPGAYWETTGCGNNLRCDNPPVRSLILDSLTYWLDEMGVDGFRFDLAPVLGRVSDGTNWNFSQDATTLTNIAALGQSKNAEMIAEAWDTDYPGGYQVGAFPAGWGDWNGRYRDTTRGYINNGETSKGGITYTDAFHGDYGNYFDGGTGGPANSINFVVAHDGLTLADLVSYPGSGNARNSTLTWPFGPSDGGNGDDNKIGFGSNPAMRRQAVRNYFTWQMFSRGVPMIVYGDEFGRTQNGNNNPYNIDSAATWNNYLMIGTDSPHTVDTGSGGSYDNNFGTDAKLDGINGLFVFASKVMNLRKSSPALTQSDYSMGISYKKEDGVTGLNSSTERCAWIRIDGSEAGDSDYLLFSNMYTANVFFTIPAADSGKQWVRIIDTASWAETDNNWWDAATGTVLTGTYEVKAWSIVVLKETDAPPPVDNPVLSPAGSSFSGSVTVTSSCATAGAVIRYTLDGSDPEASSTVFPTEGLSITTTTTVSVRAFKEGMSASAVVRATYTRMPSGLVENPYGVMLQGFNWASANGAWYTTISSNAAAIKDTFEYVWFPPPSDADSTQGYLPRKLDVLDSSYGTQAELVDAITAISPAKAIADVVINHRVGTSTWGTFTNPAWAANYYSITSDDEGFTDPLSDMKGSSATGAADTGEGYSAGRDLDHTNATVRSGIVSWMNTVLKGAGFVGWRYDYVKGYGGEYVGYYNEMTDSAFSVGEYWPTAGFSTANSAAWKIPMLDWTNKTDDTLDGVPGRKSRVFDFVLKGNLNNAFGWKTSTDSSRTGLRNLALLADANNIFRAAPQSAVTFVDNHDTGSTQQHWELDPADLAPAYAFILTHPGYPCVAWQHYFTGTDTQYQADTASTVTDMGSSSSYTLRQHIDRLIGIRETVKIRYDSPVSVLASGAGYYAARISGDAAENGEIIVVIGSGWTPASLPEADRTGYTGNTPIYMGSDFAIWQKGVTGGTPPAITFYFKIPTWIDAGVELYTDGNGTSWSDTAGVAMTQCATETAPGIYQWYKRTVPVLDINQSITYQPRMKQGTVVKYMHAPSDSAYNSADAVISAPNGYVVIDATGDLFWSGDNFSTTTASITTPATDPAY